MQLSCGASKLNTETGSPARPTIIVEKLTVKLDAQQLMTYLCILPLIYLVSVNAYGIYENITFPCPKLLNLNSGYINVNGKQ